MVNDILKALGLDNDTIRKIIDEYSGIIDLKVGRFKFDVWSLDEFDTDYDLGIDIYWEDWSWDDLLDTINEIMAREGFDIWTVVTKGNDIYIISFREVDNSGGSISSVPEN